MVRSRPRSWVDHRFLLARGLVCRVRSSFPAQFLEAHNHVLIQRVFALLSCKATTADPRFRPHPQLQPLGSDDLLFLLRSDFFVLLGRLIGRVHRHCRHDRAAMCQTGNERGPGGTCGQYSRRYRNRRAQTRLMYRPKPSQIVLICQANTT